MAKVYRDGVLIPERELIIGQGIKLIRDRGAFYAVLIAEALGCAVPTKRLPLRSREALEACGIVHDDMGRVANPEAWCALGPFDPRNPRE